MLQKTAFVSPVRLLRNRLIIVCAAIAAAFLLSVSVASAASDEEIEDRLRDQFGPAWDSGDWPEGLKEAFRQAERDRPPPREFTPEELAEQRQRAEERAEEAAKAEAERRAEFERWMHKPVRNHEGEVVNLRSVAEERRSSLAVRAVEIRQRQEDARQAAIDWARSAGQPVRFESPDRGSVAELMAITPHGPAFYSTLNLGAAETSFTDRLWSGQATGAVITGNGTTLAMWDAGKARTTHNEFLPLGRVSQQDGAQNLVPHATRVAGTLVAAGTQNFGASYGHAAKGMSPAADLHAYDWNDDIAKMIDAAINDGILVSNHSYGWTAGWFWNEGVGLWYWYGDLPISTVEDWKFGFYWSESAMGVPGAREIDEIVFGSPHYLPVWAAGNDRDYGPQGKGANGHAVWLGTNWGWSTSVRNLGGEPDGFDTILPQGVAKNILTVGAVEEIPGGYSEPSDVVLGYFSAFGPTDDGRIKPDIVAKGVAIITSDDADDDSYTFSNPIDGTSFAAPTVAGSANLLTQLHSTLHPDAPPLLASSLKALLLHTASQAGAPGPDYRYGWGLLDTERGAQVIDANHASGSRAHIKEITLPDGDLIEFPVVASGTEPFVVTIVWSDPAGPVIQPALNPVTLALVNDLDLRIERSATSQVFDPWILDPTNPGDPATTGDNFRDNVEQVWIENPVADEEYIIRVTHKGTLSDGHQVVSMIITGIVAQPKPDLRISAVDSSGTGSITVLWPTVVGQSYRFEESPDLVSWTETFEVVNATKPMTAVELEHSAQAGRWFFRIVETD